MLSKESRTNMAGHQTYSPSKLRNFCIDLLTASGRKKPKTDHPPPVPVKDVTKNLLFDDSILIISLTVVAFAVRLYKINYPTSVVFDEVHFGGFASR